MKQKVAGSVVLEVKKSRLSQQAINEQQIMREMRRKILEVSLGQIYTTVNVNDDDIVNDNDILFLQSLPDDEMKNANALYLCIVNKVIEYLVMGWDLGGGRCLVGAGWGVGGLGEEGEKVTS